MPERRVLYDVGEMVPDLKACPFCGVDPQGLNAPELVPGAGVYYVMCHNSSCFSMGPRSFNRLLAARLWNQRLDSSVNVRKRP